MVHLAQLLIKKFLDQINPEKTEKIVVLEKGSEPVPWTIGLLDFGHPRTFVQIILPRGEGMTLRLRAGIMCFLNLELTPNQKLLNLQKFFH
ncbi:MAG: hypothetical protein CM1200mP30_32890 [Pseudomonadota bacterium]|nr:MAG: hypothetical protein CM1200mP30_32890 [Pseudomonadota bacterium]